MEWHGDIVLTVGAAAFACVGSVPSAVASLGALSFHLFLVGRRRIALAPLYVAVLAGAGAALAVPRAGVVALLARCAVAASLVAAAAVDAFVLRISAWYPRSPSGPAAGCAVGLLSLPLREPSGTACAVHVYYPAGAPLAGSPAPTAAPYATHGAALGRGVAHFMSVPGAAFAWLQHARPWAVAGSAGSAPLYTPPVGGGRVPVAVFSHGLSGSPDVYAAMIGDLVARGHVVFAPEHADGSAAYATLGGGDDIPHVRLTARERSDRRAEYARRHAQLKQRVDEARAAVSAAESLARGVARSGGDAADDAEWALALAVLGGRLDTRSVIATGHSFGGATAIALGERDSRVTGVVALDPWFFPLAATTLARGVTRIPVVSIFGEGFMKWADNVVAMKLMFDVPTRAAAVAAAARAEGARAEGALDVADSNGVTDKAGSLDPRWAPLPQPAPPAKAGPAADARAVGVHPRSGVIVLRDIMHQSFSDFGLLAPLLLRAAGNIGTERSAEAEVALIRRALAAAMLHCHGAHAALHDDACFDAAVVMGADAGEMLRADTPAPVE